jgi:hypothetical protein
MSLECSVNAQPSWLKRRGTAHCFHLIPREPPRTPLTCFGRIFPSSARNASAAYVIDADRQER